MAQVRVKASVRRGKRGVIAVKPYVRRGRSGSLSMLHVKGRNRKPGRLPIGSNLATPKSAPGSGPNLRTMPIYDLASLIERDWGRQGKGVNYAARPYLDAMHSMSSHKENYYMDPGHMVIRYFLSNARGWKGETAKKVKAELNRRLKT